MKRRIKFNWARGIRVTIAVVLLIILSIITRYFISHSRKQLEIPIVPKELTQHKIEKREQIEHFEFKGEKGRFQVRGDRHYAGEDDNYYLEGKVEIIDFGKRKEQDTFLYGDKVIYDKEWNHFLLSGQVKVKYKDAIIKAVLLYYDSEKELFSSDKGVSFSSPRITGSAQKMVYSMKQERVRLQGSIHLEMKPKLETSFPLIVKGNTFDYSRKSKKGVMEGDVRLFHGKSQASAESSNFELFPDEEQMKSLFLKGKAKASLIQEEKKNEERKIEAEKIRVEAFQNLSKIQSVEAEGNCTYKHISPSGSLTLINAESIKFALNDEGELREFYAKKKARMVAQGESSEERQIIIGEEMILDGKTNVLSVKGKGKFEAKVTSSLSEIFAEEIAVFLDNNNLEAKGGIKVVLKAQNKEKESADIFSKEQPVFITSKEMRYFEEEKRFLFSGNVKVWQEKEMLFSKEVTLDSETGKILCTGGVRSIFPYKPEEGEERRIEISADKMTFKPDENLISYEGDTSLKVEDIKLQAQTISVYQKEEHGDMKRIVAQGKVVIVQNLREGRGERARYDLDKETIVLLGNPVLIEKDKGKTTGDKLTFHIADGKIVVESKDRERSVTVIK